MLDGACDGVGNLLAAGYVGALGYLVAYAPQDDGGVVAVAAHHECGIVLEVGDARSYGLSVADDLLLAGEVITVVIAPLGFLPLVETFVDDEQAQAVASVEESLGRQVVAGADGIEALRLEQLGLADLSSIDGGGAQQAVVMVDAAAAQLGGLAVEQEAPLGREGDAAHAEGNDQGIVLAGCGAEADAGGVTVRRIRRPQVGGLQREFGADGVLAERLCGGGDDVSPGIGDGHQHLARGRFSALIEDLGGDADAGFLALECGSIDVGVPLVEMHLVRDLKPHMTIDAAARVPTAVQPFADAVDSDGDELRVLRVEVLRAAENRVEVHHERHVAEDVHPGFDAIDPHLGLVIYSVKAEAEELLPEGLIDGGAGQAECLAIPAGAAEGLSRIGVAGAESRERPHLPVFPFGGLLAVVVDVGHRLHAGVVGHNDLSPPGVVVVHGLGIDGGTTMKAPALVEGLLALGDGDGNKEKI